MTGKFSIKRRRVSAPATRLSKGVRSFTPLGVSSVHAGSKPSYIHLTDPTPAQRFERAQAWHASTGRPLPPSMRPRQPLQPPAALDVRSRISEYLAHGVPSAAAVLTPLSTGDLLDSPLLTPAQRRRLLHKAGAHGERPVGFTPAAGLTPGPRAPHSPAQRRRARKDARQRARHDDRLAGHHRRYPGLDVGGS